MRRIAAALGALTLTCCAAPVAGASAAATPDYFPFPAGYSVSNFGVTADAAGNVWFTAQSPPNGAQPVPSLARVVPAQVAPGTSNGIAFFPTPDPPGVTCCANQVRSVAYNKVDHKLYYVRSDGNLGSGDPGALVPGTTTGLSYTSLPGHVDLWDVAAAKGPGAWFTEYSSSNVAPYYGARVAYYGGGAPGEGPNVAIQNGNTEINDLRYDAKPAGVVVDENGRPWFAEEDPGNPGYRLATWSGSGDVYQTHEMAQYTMASIGLGAGAPRQITAAPDDALWMTSWQGYANATANAVVQIVPGATATTPPVATVYKTSTTSPPLGLAADDAGNIWFGTASPGPPGMVGRLTGVVGAGPGTGGGATPAPGPAPPIAPATPTTPPLVLKPATIGTARVEPPQVGNGAINANQICVGPPAARCSLVYLIKEHEYVTGFPSSAGAAKKKKARHKPRVLGTRTVTLHGGQTAKVTIRLNRLGARILKGKGKLKVDFTATQQLAGGTTKVLTRRTLTMKASKKKAGKP